MPLALMTAAQLKEFLKKNSGKDGADSSTEHSDENNMQYKHPSLLGCGTVLLAE
jgi:hypothetical protein